MTPRIQIIATIGPASADPATIGALIDVGMDLARLNFSWGTHEEHRSFVTAIRAEAAQRNVTIPIIQDVSGPRVQTGSEHAIDRSLPALTTKDRADIAAFVSLQPAYIALSFVAAAADIELLRTYQREIGSTSKVIAKIERQEAIDHLDEIIDAADAIMVARGDLGEAVPFETLPFVKQDILKRCNDYGKPGIVATEMLSSMLGDPDPSRADISDIADAVVDGASATMLSNETAVGTNPIEAVAVMRKVVDEAYRHVSPPIAWL